MKKFIILALFIVGSFILGSCKEEPVKEKESLSLTLTALTEGLEFENDTLISDIQGLNSVELLISNDDNISLNRVDFRLETENNTNPESNWYKVLFDGSKIMLTVEAFPESEEKYRSVDISVCGISDYYDILPAEFTLYQLNYKRSNGCMIESVTIPGQSRKSDVYYDAVVVVHMPYGTDCSNLTPTITVSPKATCSPASGVPQNFESPVIYRVTAEDGVTTMDWKVMVELDDKLRTEAEILDFSLDGIMEKAIIEGNNISVLVNEQTDLTSLMPKIVVSPGATVVPGNGDIVDFSEPVEFVVTAEDKVTTQTYIVNVSKAGVCNLLKVGSLADGVIETNEGFSVSVNGSDYTKFKAELSLDGSVVGNLSRYDFSCMTIDAATGDSADWLSVESYSNGEFAFSVSPNSSESIRRGEIIVDVKDREEQHVFAKGKFNIVQDGMGEYSELVEMVYVEGGRFLQGDSEDAGIIADSLRWCNLSDYYIGKYEITQAQYEAVMGYNPSEFQKDGENCPVECVTFWDAMEFCDKLSEREGYSKFYNLTNKIYSGDHIIDAERNCDMSATGYRLPTLAEWEYAAKGGEDQINAELFSFAGCNQDEIKEYASFGENNGERPEPVGSKKPNTLGIYDMSGNVAEWCHDWKYDLYIGLYPSTDEVFDPFGPSEPYSVDKYASSQGGYYATYTYNLNVIRVSTDWADIGFGDNTHITIAAAYGFRVVIRK